MYKKNHSHFYEWLIYSVLLLWSHLGLNQGPPDYESGATNQLSYRTPNSQYITEICCKGTAFFWNNQINLIFLWKWRDSNPRPNKEPICFLHAYLGLNFRAIARPKPPTITLSAKISFLHRSLQEPALIFPHRLILSASGRWLGAMSRFSTLCRN